MPEHSGARPKPEPGLPLAACLQADVPRLKKLAKTKDRSALDGLLEQSRAAVEARRARLPKPSFPDELPVSHKLDEISAALEKHQVIVVCGETGSGKSTQLPKLMLALGRGTRGQIAHTQPRRVAARSIARRLAEELNTELGREVGYKIRFADKVSPDSFIKVLTDGMLLAETQGDRYLDQYDTIIIDEAHERSLNIDFLLGYLKQLLPKRPDLKVIITSATIDPESFSRHFNGAPVVMVSGRTYPVDVLYRPLESDDPEEEGEESRELSQTEGILAAVDECWRHGPGDILVFLSGEREIRDAAEALRKHHPKGTEVLPLFSRLSAAEQDRIFNPGHARRIVLATNVAETSLTVPRIRYVIDPGAARISRYSHRTKVQRLPIEKISQASANQRKGRCGRVSDGLCIRLYSDEDFNARPEFTDPEIHRTNLASVILQMQLLKLGDIRDFPFLAPPDEKFINDGYRLLQELEAVDERRHITLLGRRIAKLPVDPKLARILLAAEKLNCLRELLITASVLAIQDPRERPIDKQQAADEAHAKFDDKQSDFLSFINIWNAYHEERKHRSQNQLRKWCAENFLSYLRMREWQDIHQQLTTQMKGEGARVNQADSDYSEIHRAILTGFLSQIGVKEEEGEYLGARGLKFRIFPGSGLFKINPKWIVAGEVVETGRLWARKVAKVEPAWIEEAAVHLVQREYLEPHWEPESGRVAAFEKVTLYGIAIVPKRRVNYGPVDPAVARTLFIREGLVRGSLQGSFAFLEHNLNLAESVEDLEARVRRRDILVDEAALEMLYAERLPDEVYDGITFGKWYRENRQDAERRLRFTKEEILARSPDEITAEQFPEATLVNGIPMPLEYAFAPGGEADGVILNVPVELIGQVPAERLEWLVPGFIEEKVTAMIRALPKAMRRNFVPAPDFARAAVEALPFGEGSLREKLAEQLQRMAGMPVDAEVFHDLEIPEHLTMKIRVQDENGKTLSLSTKLGELQERFAARATQQVRGLETDEWPEIEATDWSFGVMPEFVEIRRGAASVRAYPAISDREFRVAATLCATAEEAARVTRRGLLRLLELTCRESVKFARKNIPGIHELCLKYKTIGGCDALREDIVFAALERTTGEMLDAVRDEDRFRQLQAGLRAGLQGEVNALGELAGEILSRHHAIRRQLSGSVSPALLGAIQNIDRQLKGLVHAGFLRTTPAEWLREIPRYLQAVEIRLERLPNNPGKDRAGQNAVCVHVQRLEDLLGENRVEICARYPELGMYRWMIEEYRVSLFAQELKTRLPVSDKRLDEQWKAARKSMRSS